MQKLNLKKEVDGLPRRSRLDCLTPTELVVFHAIQAVEEIGAHPLLTDAVILLGQAKDKIADYLETKTGD